LLHDRPRRWRFNHSPLFLEFLQGNWQLECTPWGNPTYNVFGWQKPCYLLDEGCVQSFQELLDTTQWDNYGRASGNPKCRDCMMHCGYEPTAVSATFGSLRGLCGAARSVLFGSRRQSVPPAEFLAKNDRQSLPQPKANLLPLASPRACSSRPSGEPAVVSTIALLAASSVAPGGCPDMILERR
jgi:hypothetical protein